MDTKTENDIFIYTINCMKRLRLEIEKISTIDDVKKLPPYNKKFYKYLKEKYLIANEHDLVWEKITKKNIILGLWQRVIILILILQIPNMITLN